MYRTSTRCQRRLLLDILTSTRSPGFHALLACRSLKGPKRHQYTVIGLADVTLPLQLLGSLPWARQIFAPTEGDGAASAAAARPWRRPRPGARRIHAACSALLRIER